MSIHITGIKWIRLYVFPATYLSNCNNKHAYAGVNDCFTHLTALLVLHNTAAFWPTQLALLGIIPPTEVTQSPSKYPPGFHTVDTLGNSWKPVYIPRGNYGNSCIGNPWKPMETIAF